MKTALYETTNWFLNIDFLAPFSWCWTRMEASFKWMWNGSHYFIASMMDYQGFSSLHLSPLSWVWTAFNSSVNFVQEGATNAFIGMSSLDLLYPITWTLNSSYSLISSLMGFLTSSFGSATTVVAT